MEGTTTSGNGEGYSIVAYIVGIIIFIGVWIYAISEWGFLLGVALGWFPALIVGCIGGFLWPIIALLILWLIVSSL